MRLTIIRDDNAIYVDGYCITGIDCSSLPENVKAIQWSGTAGHLEFDAELALSPQAIDTVAPYQSLIDAWTAAKEIIDNPPPQPATLQNLLAAAQKKRRALEIGGVTIGGIPVYTDPESQAKLHAARTAAKEDANYTVKWKTSAGTFATLDAATIIALADGVRAHVQMCFVAEEAVAAKINSNTYTTFVQVDQASEWAL